jgi:hypothetical protein
MVDVTPGFTKFWIDGSNTSDITIYLGVLDYFDWISVNKTLWEPSNIDPSSGVPSMNVIIDGWGNDMLLYCDLLLYV